MASSDPQRADSPAGSFLELLSALSTRLVAAPESSLDLAIRDAMAETGAFYGADRVMLRWIDAEAGTTAPTHAWLADPSHGVLGHTREFYEEHFSRFARGEVGAMHLPGSADFRPEDVAALAALGIRTMLCVGIDVAERRVATFHVACAEVREAWSEVAERELRLLGQVFAVAHLRAEGYREQRRQDARYRSVVEDQTEFILRWIPSDGTRTFVNESYARALGQPASDLVGTSFFPDSRSRSWRRSEPTSPA